MFFMVLLFVWQKLGEQDHLNVPCNDNKKCMKIFKVFHIYTPSKLTWTFLLGKSMCFPCKTFTDEIKYSDKCSIKYDLGSKCFKILKVLVIISYLLILVHMPTSWQWATATRHRVWQVFGGTTSHKMLEK